MTTIQQHAEISRTIGKTLRYLVVSGEVPGLAYLIEKDGICYSSAFGTASASGAPMQPDTIFRIASLSKPIAAAATMRLIERGQMTLDQPVHDWLPELRDQMVVRSLSGDLDDTVPLRRPITVEDLLTFRMGTGIVLAPPGTYPIQQALDDAGLGIGPPDPALPLDPDQWIGRFASVPLVHQPGEEWMYVASSEVLGVLLARAAGMPLPDLLKQLIFEPLGMVDTGFTVTPEKSHRFSSQFARDSETRNFIETDPPVGGDWNRPPAFPSAGGGLVSTINDYSIFARMLLNRGIHDASEFLSSESIDLMTRNHLTERQRKGGQIILGEGNGWGYGMSVRVDESSDPGVPGCYGWNGGFGTTWINDPANGLIAMFFTQVQFESAELPRSARQFLELAYRI
jgi:CubicO group peptidase (beta-lactamase class C family)